MGIDWNDIETAYAELQAARGQGQTALLMRITEMHQALDDALTAQVAECVTVDTWSWQRVADALGVTRQAASKRFRRVVFPATPVAP